MASGTARMKLKTVDSTSSHSVMAKYEENVSFSLW